MSQLIMQATDAFDQVRTRIGEALPRDFDEVAILVPSVDDAKQLVSLSGLEYFNQSQDLVTWVGEGQQGEYSVEYRFLRDGDRPEFRYEVMALLGGKIGPVHEAHARVLDSGGKGSVVHVSYKPKADGAQAYHAELNFLRAQGFVIMQSCSSTYGLFSYWIHPDLPDGVFVKPRVNLRDLKFAQNDPWAD